MNDLSEEVRQRILDLLRRERKIEAIKAVREATGAGLAEAKEVVEWIGSRTSARAAEPSLADSVDPALRERLQQLLAAGRKIEAIKHHREATGLGLTESKAIVEALARSLPPAAPGVAQTTHGCASVLVLGIFGFALALLST